MKPAFVTKDGFFIKTSNEVLGRGKMKRTPSIIILAIVAVLSGTVIYPVVHEGGHFLAGHLQGVEARDAVWTVWGGRPHVSFGATPAHAIPWINAGGMILPTVVGILLMVIWFAVSQRVSFVVGAVIWIPGLVLLSGNLGAIAESASSSYSHMRPLGAHFGLSGAAAFIFQASPALLSVLLFVFFVRRLRSTSHKKTAQHDAAQDGESARASSPPVN